MLGFGKLRKLSVIFILLILLTFAGCKSENTVSEEPVKINMPEDDSVNGYRLKESENTNYNTIDADKVAVQSDKTAKPDSKAIYCANKNSKIFHKSTCKSVKSIKEENKFFSSDKEGLTKDGYKPCKQCKP